GRKALIQILVTLQAFRLEALVFILLFFELAAQLRNFLLHLLELVEQHALRRSRCLRTRSGVGAGRTIPRRWIAAALLHGAAFQYGNLRHCRKRQGECQKGQNTAAITHGSLLTQLYATVLSPGLLVVASGNRTLFAVGNQFQLSRGNALQNQVALNGLGTTLAQSHVVLTGTALVSVAFQNDASAVAFQVLGVYVQSAHGFGFQVGAVVLEVESGDSAQSRFFAQAAINSASVGTVACVRVNSTFASSVAAFGGATYSNGESQGQCSELTEFQHFHHVTPKEPQLC